MQGSQKPIEIFCSYAAADEKWYQELENHLSLLQHQGLVSIWHFRDIIAGTDWTTTIDTHVNSAAVVLLLISSDFLASKYSYGIEMKRALERDQTKEARVIPILLRPMDWKGAPFAHLRALPTNTKPITTWSNLDEAFTDVAIGIRRAIEDLTASSAHTPQRMAPSLTTPTLSQFPAPPRSHQPVPDQVIQSSQAGGGFTPPPASPVPLPSTKADQFLAREVLATTPPSSNMTVPAGVPTSPASLTLAPVSPSGQHRGVLNMRVLFPLVLVLLIALSGGSFSYFMFIAQRPSTLSLAQVTAPTATAAAQVYAAQTTRQGVMFGFDAAHTHNNRYENVLSLHNISRLTLLWSFPTENNIESLPAVANGMVYIGSWDHKLYAFDAHCHNACLPLWSFATGGRIYSSPAVAGGIVYVGSDDHKLYAFDAHCHNACLPLWSFPTSDKINSSPAVAGGMVYVGSQDHKLYAFDATCRNACLPLWTFATGDKIYSSPAVASGIVYVGSWDHSLYAFDATCRNACLPLWTFATGSAISSSPAVAGDMVYVGSDDHNLHAFDATCRYACLPLWSFPTGGAINSSPAVAGGIVYIGSQDHKLYAFDATCRYACLPLWSFPTGDQIWSSPAVADGMVYVGSWDHSLYAFDATCRNACLPLWTFATRDKISWSSPAVADGMVYVGSSDHNLYAFGLAA